MLLSTAFDGSHQGNASSLAIAAAQLARDPAGVSKQLCVQQASPGLCEQSIVLSAAAEKMRDALWGRTYVVDAVRASLVELHPAGCLPGASPLQRHLQRARLPSAERVSVAAATAAAQQSNASFSLAISLVCTRWWRQQR